MARAGRVLHIANQNLESTPPMLVESIIRSYADPFGTFLFVSGLGVKVSGWDSVDAVALAINASLFVIAQLPPVRKQPQFKHSKPSFQENSSEFDWNLFVVGFPSQSKPVSLHKSSQPATASIEALGHGRCRLEVPYLLEHGPPQPPGSNAPRLSSLLLE